MTRFTLDLIEKLRCEEKRSERAAHAEAANSRISGDLLKTELLVRLRRSTL